jgi:hypothetical protein
MSRANPIVRARANDVSWRLAIRVAKFPNRMAGLRQKLGKLVTLPIEPETQIPSFCAGLQTPIRRPCVQTTREDWRC